MSEFTEFIRDVFVDFGEVHCRRMFGGYGVYHRGLMFALIAEEVLYLKADEETAEFFTSRNLPPFQYTRQGKTCSMSYFQAPEEIFDDPVEAARVAETAYRTALRGGAGKPRKKSGPRKKPAA